MQHTTPISRRSLGSSNRHATHARALACTHDRTVQADNLAAFNAFILYFVLLKYVQRMPGCEVYIPQYLTRVYTPARSSAQLLFHTISSSAVDLMLFMVMFAIIFLGFSVRHAAPRHAAPRHAIHMAWHAQVSFHTAYGLDLPEFRSMLVTMFTLFRMLIGNFDYEAMDAANSVLTPLLFPGYMIFSTWVHAHIHACMITHTCTHAAHLVGYVAHRSS